MDRTFWNTGRARFVELDWRELLAGSIVVAAFLAIFGYLCVVGESGTHSPGWQWLAVDLLAALGHLGLVLALGLVVAVGLMAWHRTASAPPAGLRRPRHHVRHYSLTAVVELLFWFVAVTGLGILVELVIFGSASPRFDAWIALELVAACVVNLVLGVGGALATRKLLATWLAEHLIDPASVPEALA